MFGAIIGDIVGSIYEWNNIKTKDFPCFGSNCTFTDDSVMTCAVAHAFLKAGTESEDKFTKQLVDSMQLFGRAYPHRGYGPRFEDWLMSSQPRPYNSFGNGSAMRVSPAAYTGASLEEVIEHARWTALVSHDHPEGIKGAQCAAAVIFMALRGADNMEISELVTGRFGYDLSRSLDEIRPGHEFDVSCMGTLPTAVTAFLEAESFEDAVRNAISVGGDSDTLAAISGSMAQARFGIPDDIRKQAENLLDEPLLDLCREFEDRIISRRLWEQGM